MVNAKPEMGFVRFSEIRTVEKFSRIWRLKF